jgi:hypothetical protein
MNDTILKYNNLMIDIEKSSSKFICNEMFFIVLLTFSCSIDKVSSYVKKELSRANPVDPPSSAYYDANTIAFLYSSRDCGEHILRGDQQSINSYFTSRATIELQTHIETKIIELKTHTKIISYFQHILYKNFKDRGHIGTFIKFDKGEWVVIQEIINLRDIDRYRKIILGF